MSACHVMHPSCDVNHPSTKARWQEGSFLSTAVCLLLILLLCWSLVSFSHSPMSSSVSPLLLLSDHRRRSSVNLGGKTFLPENMHENLTKCPNFTRFLPEKNSFCPNLGGSCPPCPPSPTPMYPTYFSSICFPSSLTPTYCIYLVYISSTDHNQYAPRHSSVTSHKTLSSASRCLLFLPIMSSTASYVACTCPNHLFCLALCAPIKSFSKPTVCNISSFVFCSVHDILIMRDQIHTSNASSRSTSRLWSVNDSLPYVFTYPARLIQIMQYDLFHLVKKTTQNALH